MGLQARLVAHHREQDTRSRVYLAMQDRIQTDAFHDLNARRENSRCHPNTRKEALKTTSDWITDSASHCLWLNGPAGAGKSAIAYTVAEQCRLDGSLGATYFFTKGSASGSARGRPHLFSTLAYQLMSVFPDLDEHLWTVIRADRTIFKGSLCCQLDKLIIQPFLQLAKTSRSTSAVVIIDGLDECDDDSIQGEIVQLILGLEQHSLPLQFIISSRPEPAIRHAFESSPCPSLTRLSLARSLESDNDIRLYLRHEFERIYQKTEVSAPRATSRLPWPSTSAIETLVCKSSGHFIYAATVIRFVQEGGAHPIDQLNAILGIPSEFTSLSAAGTNIFTDSIAFQELDGLYLYILRKHQDRVQLRNQVWLAKILRAIIHFGNLDNIYPDDDDGFPGDIEIIPNLRPGSARMIETIFNLRPGSARMIETIFNLRPGSVRIMLADLHSILDVPAGANKPLQFLHASFNDFLDDPERSYEFYMDTSHFNVELACWRRGWKRLKPVVV